MNGPLDMTRVLVAGALLPQNITSRVARLTLTHAHLTLPAPSIRFLREQIGLSIRALLPPTSLASLPSLVPRLTR